MKLPVSFRLHLIVLLWGFTGVLGREITVSSLPLVFLRMLFACGFLFIYIRLIRKESFKMDRKLAWSLFGIGLLIAVHWLLFFASIKASNVSIALSCLSLSTLFVALLEPWIYKRKLDPYEIILGLVIVGCMFFIFKTELRYITGLILGLGCAFVGAVFSVLNGKFSRRASAGTTMMIEMLAGSLLTGAILLIRGEMGSLSSISQKDVWLIFLLASVFTAYPMLESIALMRYISPFTLVLTVNLEPIYGMLLAAWRYNEHQELNPSFYLASSVMILSIVLNGVIKGRKRNL